MTARHLRLFALLIAALTVLGSIGAATTVRSGSGASGAPGSPPILGPSATAAPANVPVGIPNGSTNLSGPGVFYGSRALPSAPFSAQSCSGGLCYNESNDVSVNWTSRGLLAAAYTTLTDESPCVSMRSSSVSNIAWTTSSDGGASWSAPRYLGNPVCTGTSAGYPDAWQPSLTSLANGTLVLAYVEFNLTAGQLPPPSPSAWPPTQSRLVLTESYDNGTTWSAPQVLNISNPASAPPGVQFTPAFPSVTAYGATIYVTWMSLSFQDTLGSIALLVSSTGGRTWSPTLTISTGPFADYSMNPAVAVDSSGRLYIAYTSNVTYSYFFCGIEGCGGYSDGTWDGKVWVASSDSNVTVFS